MNDTASPPNQTQDIPSSASVAFWPVHEYVGRMVRVSRFPMAGTPAWCALADDDDRKLAAVLDAGQHHALRVETAQQARAEASKAIAAAADWRAIAQEFLKLHAARKSGARIERVA